MLAHGRPPDVFHPNVLFPGLPNDRTPQASSAPSSVRCGFSNLKNKKHSDISFPHCRTHATAARASIALLDSGGGRKKFKVWQSKKKVFWA
jgi:hypothetical protein